MSLDAYEDRRSGRIDGTVMRAFDRWCDFWWTPADPAPLCLMRILVGGMLIYSHLVWGLNLEGFLGPAGWNSSELIRDMQRGQWNYSFWWDVPVESMQTVHQYCLVILVLFCVGFCTRLTSILSFLIHVSYCQRAAMSNYGLDQAASVLLLYLAIGPSGSAYSVDRILVRFWNRFVRRIKTETKRSSLAGLSLRLIQVHYCLIYFFAATAKLQGETWWTGEAIWRCVANYEYQSADLTWLAWFPELYELLTHVTLIWELTFACLVWVKAIRPLVLLAGILMHLGIGAFLGMWTFGFMMIFGYLAFVNPNTIRSVLRNPFWVFRR